MAGKFAGMFRPRTLAFADYHPGDGDGDGAGGGGAGGGAGDGDKGNPAAKPDVPETISLTSAQLDDRLKRAGASAVNGLLGELGFKSADDLRGVVKTQREAADAQKTEAERAIARAQEAGAAAEAAQQALAAERRSNAVMQAALKANVPGDRVGAVVRLVDTSAITAAADGSLLGVDEAIAALVAENPWITAGAGKTAVGTGAGAGAQGNGGNAAALTTEQQWAARALGVPAERYAAAAQAKPGDANNEYVANTLEAQAAAMRGKK